MPKCQNTSLMGDVFLLLKPVLAIRWQYGNYI